MSYGIYIGKNHTADSVSYLAGYGDEPSSHWLDVVERKQHPEGATIKVGVTAHADLPGLLSEIPQARETARHIRVSYSVFKGTPAPLTNGGLNEYGVAVRDIWSPSRPELVAMTPKDQTGPNYSDLSRIVLERAKTAVEGVRLIGELIAEHGHSTYGGNSNIIADSNEAWVVIQFAGGQGLWVAERLNDDSIRASRPGYIGTIPVEQPDSPDFLYSPNLVTFATAQGWYDQASGEPFNVNKVYGDGKGKWDGVKWIEDELTSLARRPEKIAIEDVIWAVRTERLTGDTAGYGQVVPLIDAHHPELRMLWHTQIAAVAAPFVPVFMGVRKIPPEFQIHRYLTDGEAERFLDGRHSDDISLVPQDIEATRSASYVFKRLLNLVLRHSEVFLPEVTVLWKACERKLLETSIDVAKAARILLDAGEPALAARYLTYFTNTELVKALDSAQELAAALDIRGRALYGINAASKPLGPEQVW
ncbi:C69 family dipeptidase [Sinorhizobium meliloti]|uniref:C69 family dipeptidase n=1 Tax=Rhizobium meliloti TaxID=382 RepID=UPI000B4A279F|nr:C69 family dipeptidase [Sinorhizobium meliloti]ASP83188.1 dipeptidase [Sinorhizobium meliloti]MQW25300.1 dipeptidase [Sinorhizobium meliloti]RVJ65220.1 dipeptidase [Sinorhizobium meliloti]